MKHLVIYTRDKITGATLCHLLKRRNLNPEYYTKYEVILNKIRFNYDNIIILDISSIFTMSYIAKDIEEILKFTDKMPVIMLSPYSSNEKKIKKIQQSGYYILEKPINVDKLAELVKKINQNNNINR
mgnify:CR=1 FL=1